MTLDVIIIGATIILFDSSAYIFLKVIRPFEWCTDSESMQDNGSHVLTQVSVADFVYDTGGAGATRFDKALEVIFKRLLSSSERIFKAILQIIIGQIVVVPFVW